MNKFFVYSIIGILIGFILAIHGVSVVENTALFFSIDIPAVVISISIYNTIKKG